MLTRERLAELFNYDASTGQFTRTTMHVGCTI